MRVPLISSLSEHDQLEWIAALNQAIGSTVVCHLDQLTDQELLHSQVAIVANPDLEQIKTLPNLVWVQSLWAGVEKLFDAGLNESIKIVRLVDERLSDTMAEAALAWVLYLHRDMPVYRAQEQRSTWQQHPVKLAGERQVGILGLGKLGQRVAHTLTDVGFKVRGWNKASRFRSNPPYESLQGEQGLNDLLESSEILIVLLPLTDKTKGLLNSRRLSKLPSGACLINFARGPIVDEKALVEQLDSQHLKHAVLDVFDKEPLAKSHPFWQHPSVTVLPHIAAPTHKPSAAQLVAQHLSDYFEYGHIPDSVDKSRGY